MVPSQKVILIKKGTRCRLKDNVESGELKGLQFELDIDAYDFQKHVFVKVVSAGEKVHEFHELPLSSLVFPELEKHISGLVIYSAHIFSTFLGKLEKESLLKGLGI